MNSFYSSVQNILNSLLLSRIFSMNLYKIVNVPAVVYHSKDRILDDITESTAELSVFTEQRNHSLYEIRLH